VEFPIQYGATRRSGDFVTGAEIAALTAGREGKVFWTPLHDPASVHSTLLVRGTFLDQPGITSHFSSSNYSWPFKENPPSLPIRDSEIDRAQGATYVTGVSLPNAGRWLLVATSGPDWGCFIVTVQN
jgi:hypothetical protein